MVDYDLLSSKSRKGQDQLQAFVCAKFGLEFMTTDECKRGVSLDALSALAEELKKRNTSKHEALAENDALMVHTVYAQRRANKESSKYDGFGHRTWWLTKEYHVLNYTAQVVREEGTPYIMRPEFLLNFLNLSPSVDRENAYVKELLPSHVGLQIGQHLSPGHMHRILAELDEWKDLPTERVDIRMSDSIDSLKFNRVKRYESNLELDANSEADFVLKALRDERSSLRAPH